MHKRKADDVPHKVRRAKRVRRKRSAKRNLSQADITAMIRDTYIRHNTEGTWK